MFLRTSGPHLSPGNKRSCVKQNQGLVAHRCSSSPACEVPTPECLVQVVCPNLTTGPLGHGLEAPLPLIHLPRLQPFTLPPMPAARALSLSQLLDSVCKQCLFLNTALCALPALWAQGRAVGHASLTHQLPLSPKSPLVPNFIPPQTNLS